MAFLRLFLALVLAGLASGAVAPDNLIIDLGYTKYQGGATENGINQWLGMRYAAAPLGNLRFRAPQDPVENLTVQIADKFMPVCLATTVLTLSTASNEDCLYVDVMAPVTDELLPVYIFIQGGGFNANGNPQYNGTGLILGGDKQIVVVTFNYRVGPYGFLASKEVAADGDLNVGNLDQRKVFQWVQRYIAKFGGDPTRVTIGGDSAGGASVDLHLTAYGGRDDGLFHQGAAESQSFGAQLTVGESQYQYDGLISRVNCTNATNTLQCLRNVTAEVLQSVNINQPTPGGDGGNPVYMYSNVIDGDFTQDYTYNMFANGKFLKFPVIFGDTTNEGTNFVPQGTSTVVQLQTFLKNNFVKLTNDQLAKIASLYPPAEQFQNWGLYGRALANAYGEMRYNCPGIYISSAFDGAGVNNNYLYHYNVIDPAQNASGQGVSHVLEILQIWGVNYTTSTPAPASFYTTNKPEEPVIRGYWTSFIRTGDPNVYRFPGSPVWERFSQLQKDRIMFQTNNTHMETIDQGQCTRCEYLSSIGASIAQK